MKRSKKANGWEYGKLMLEQGDINSLSEWSDDKEYCCSIMDQELDYLWDFSNGIRFIDRLYSSYKEHPDIYTEYAEDETMMERIKKNEAEMWFNSFDEVKRFINNKRAIA